MELVCWPDALRIAALAQIAIRKTPRIAARQHVAMYAKEKAASPGMKPMTIRILRSELEGVSDSDFARVVEVHAKDLRDYRDHHVLKDSEDEFWQAYPMPWTLPIIRSAINTDTLQPDYVIIDSRRQTVMKILTRLALGCAIALIPTIAIGGL